MRSHRLPQVPSAGGRPDVGLVAASECCVPMAPHPHGLKGKARARDASCAGAALWPQTRERRAFLVRTPWHDCGKSRSVETMVYPPEPTDMTDRPPEFSVANMRTRFLPVSHDARTFLNRPASPGRCGARALRSASRSNSRNHTGAGRCPALVR